MLVTEEQAKQTQCKANVLAAAILRGFMPAAKIDDEACYCDGSECMWWRWLDERRLDDAKTLGGTDIVPKPKRGYCGLGGKP